MINIQQPGRAFRLPSVVYDSCLFLSMLGTCSHACMCERAYLFTRWHAYNTGLTPDPNAAVHVTRSESDARSNAIHAARAASSQPTEPVLGVACQLENEATDPAPKSLGTPAQIMRMQFPMKRRAHHQQQRLGAWIQLR